MSEWHPIETAPKDGTWVLTWEAAGIYMARYNKYMAQEGQDPWDDATHWMPLPTPPSTKDTDDE